MSVPASLVIARIMVPATTADMTEGRLEFNPEVSGTFEAITEGTAQGVKLLVYVISMMVVMVALVELIDLCLGSRAHPRGKFHYVAANTRVLFCADCLVDWNSLE